MRSPSQMKIIQLELTNACEKACSNCTRLVGHVRNPWFMTKEQFERAVKSMDGWDAPGRVLGAMGGNPVLHPLFAELAHMFAALWGRKTPPRGRGPIKDFGAYVNTRLGDTSSGRGLWSSMGPRFYHHLETIQDVFSYWVINDHENAGLHQGLLIERAEFNELNGQSDDQWLENRDKCWVQMDWSASINPRGAYFCEVAAAIDDLFFEGKSAWPVEAGWWKRTPADFESQLHLCDHCALAQRGPSAVSHDEVDIVGRTSLPLIQAVGSKAKVEIYDPQNIPEQQENGREYRIDWYMRDPAAGELLRRVGPSNRDTFARSTTAVMVSVGYGPELEFTLPHNLGLVDHVVVVTTPEDVVTQAVCSQYPTVTVIASERCYANQCAFNKGALMNDALMGAQQLWKLDWVIFTDADVLLHPRLPSLMNGWTLNPGVLYYTKRKDILREDVAAWRAGEFVRFAPPSGHNHEASGYFQLFNRLAQATRDRWPAPLSEMFPSAGGVDWHWQAQWPVAKKIYLPEIEVTHLVHSATFGQRWNGPPQGPDQNSWRQMGTIVGTRDGKAAIGIFDREMRDSFEGCEVRIINMKNEAMHAMDWPAGGKFPAEVVSYNPKTNSLIFLGRDTGAPDLYVAYREKS